MSGRVVNVEWPLARSIDMADTGGRPFRARTGGVLRDSFGTFVNLSGTAIKADGKVALPGRGQNRAVAWCLTESAASPMNPAEEEPPEWLVSQAKAFLAAIDAVEVVS
ncbi:hypothetical protein SEA_PUPPERS_55 [Gordonia phage Puppers]|nr:hypothetical protein SEA_PUPPERS_55 [Gordonia phage Puppers]